MFYPLTVYSSTKDLATVGILYSFTIDIDFPSCFGVNDCIEHGGMECSDCVSMSGPHNGQDFGHIAPEILTLVSCFRIVPYHLPILPPK
jgi:hypothetical protein